MLDTDSDYRVAQSWEKLLRSHNRPTGGTCEETGDGETKEIELLEDLNSIDLSSSIPVLFELMSSSEQKKTLELELKNLVMKTYWDGFYNGKNTTLDK